QLVRLAPEDEGADELFEQGVAAVGAFGRGGESEAEGRYAQLGGVTVDARGQVVALVEDDEAELVAEPLHEAEGGGVGRDGERARLEVAAADESDLGLKA